MPHRNMARRVTLAVRNLLAITGRSARHDRPDHHDPDTRPQSGRAVAATPANPGVKATRVVAGALALGLALMTPLAFGSAAYGTEPTTPLPEDTTTTTVPEEVTTTAPEEVITTTAPEEVTTTTAPEEVTTTTAPEEVTTTRVAEEVTTTTTGPQEVTTTTAAPEEVTTTTTAPIECPHDFELVDGRCVSPSITLDSECWVDGVATVGITNHRNAEERPRGIPVEWSYNGSAPVEVVVPPLGTVEIEVTGGPAAGTFTVTWGQGEHWRSIVLTDEDCTVVTTTTIPEETTTTTIPEETTTTTIPEETTTTTIPEETTTTIPEETTTTVPGEETTTTDPSAVPGSTVPPTPDPDPDPDPDPVRPVVNPRSSSESLPFTGSQHLQLLGLIGIVALAAGFGMIQLVNRNR